MNLWGFTICSSIKLDVYKRQLQDRLAVLDRCRQYLLPVVGYLVRVESIVVFTNWQGQDFDEDTLEPSELAEALMEYLDCE